ncbi:MAG TPA: hypothetical protein PKC86_00495 [Candidatus Saccharibacteria bacterium]|nr:hypothetical protein [Candidatus Saccharibacteria bacterium]
MQPDHQSNYWQHDENEPKKPEEVEMYKPEPFDEPEPQAPQPEAQPANSKPVDDEPVHWQASEYINQEKNGLWFTIFGVIVIGLIAADVFLLRSYTFSILVAVMAIAVVIYSRRPPRQINYTLSGSQGLYVGEKLYHFNEFKAFGLIKDGENHSIMLLPVKRFAPGVSVYFPEEVGEEVVDILGARLPMEKLKLDVIDIVVRKLRL